MNVEFQSPTLGLGGAFSALASTSPQGVRQKVGGDDRESVSQGFEELLLGMFVKEIRKTSGVKLFGESAGSHLLETVFDQQMAHSLATSGGIGVGEQLVRGMHFDGESQGDSSREGANDASFR